VRDGEDRALEGEQAFLQGLGAGQVEVVGRLVEQQQGCPGQFQQQDLQPRLLPTGQHAEGLLGAVLQLVAGQGGHRLALPPRVLGHHYLAGGPALELRPRVGLCEQARHDAGTQPRHAGVRNSARRIGAARACVLDRAAACVCGDLGQQAQKV
jgi:hypothetical protein